MFFYHVLCPFSIRSWAGTARAIPRGSMHSKAICAARGQLSSLPRVPLLPQLQIYFSIPVVYFFFELVREQPLRDVAVETANSHLCLRTSIYLESGSYSEAARPADFAERALRRLQRNLPRSFSAAGRAKAPRIRTRISLFQRTTFRLSTSTHRNVSAGDRGSSRSSATLRT